MIADIQPSTSQPGLLPGRVIAWSVAVHLYHIPALSGGVGETHGDLQPNTTLTHIPLTV